MKITFKAGKGMEFYHDRPADWHDGDTREVSEEQGQAVTTLHPNNFFVVMESKAAPVPESNKAIDKPKRNK